MNRYLFLSAIFSCIGILACAQTPNDFSFKETYKVSTPADMVITINDGFINVNSNESREIEVFYIVKKNNRIIDMDLNELEEHVDVDVISSNHRLEIKIRQKETSWIKNWKDKYYVSLQINAPERTACNLRTSDGDISMQRFRGEQQCRTSDGDIVVEHVDGNLSARTSDGNINVSNIQGNTELITSDGDINVENVEGEANFRTSDGKIFAGNIEGNTKVVTSDGNIILENINGENTARTSDGNIVFENMRGSLSAQTSDGDIRGDLIHLTNKLYLRTSDGNISVIVPDGLGMDVRLKGEDIHTRLDNFSGDTSDHLIEGTIRGGGVEVELITSDGNISLEYK